MSRAPDTFDVLRDVVRGIRARRRRPPDVPPSVRPQDRAAPRPSPPVRPLRDMAPAAEPGWQPSAGLAPRPFRDALIPLACYLIVGALLIPGFAAIHALVDRLDIMAARSSLFYARLLAAPLFDTRGPALAITLVIWLFVSGHLAQRYREASNPHWRPPGLR